MEREKVEELGTNSLFDLAGVVEELVVFDVELIEGLSGSFSLLLE